jgi:hypothetical protein
MSVGARTWRTTSPPTIRQSKRLIRAVRLAIAAEYAAFQLGQINRKLDTMIEALTASIVKK